MTTYNHVTNAVLMQIQEHQKQHNLTELEKDTLNKHVTTLTSRGYLSEQQMKTLPYPVDGLTLNVSPYTIYETKPIPNHTYTPELALSDKLRTLVNHLQDTIKLYDGMIAVICEYIPDAHANDRRIQRYAHTVSMHVTETQLEPNPVWSTFRNLFSTIMHFESTDDAPAVASWVRDRNQFVVDLKSALFTSYKAILLARDWLTSQLESYTLHANYAYYKSKIDTAPILHSMRDHQPAPILDTMKYATNAPAPLRPLIKNLIMHLFSTDQAIRATFNYFVEAHISTYRPHDEFNYAFFKFAVRFARSGGVESDTLDECADLIDEVDNEFTSYLQVVEPSDLDNVLVHCEPSGLTPFTLESYLYSLVAHCQHDLYRTPLPKNVMPLTGNRAYDLATYLYDDVDAYLQHLANA